jgi:hypothetical protein
MEEKLLGDSANMLDIQNRPGVGGEFESGGKGYER